VSLREEGRPRRTARTSRFLNLTLIVTPQPFTKTITTLLLDIEGTTTPIDFVYNVLFPYARAHLKDYLAGEPLLGEIAGLVEENIADARRGLNPPLIKGFTESLSLDSVEAYLLWLMDQDRKSTSLKSIQGRIWDEGYRRGELRSQVFDDVPPAFKRWRDDAKDICIYSSGSVLAQKLLFANTDAGDLTPFIRGYFDTNIGEKKDSESYRRIARELKLESSAVLFVSDVTAELDAAASAECSTLLCIRPGNHPQDPESSHKTVTSFDEIVP